MKTFKLEPINLELDKPQIENWDSLYRGSPAYESIKHFILEDDLIYGLGELIATNYEHFSIGKSEIKKMLVARTDKNEILGFVIFDVFDIDTSHPEMFFQYIVLKPNYQHLGYGSEMLAELFGNLKKYAGVKPKNIFSYVHKDNEASKHLFLNFGFNFEQMTSADYTLAKTSYRVLQTVLAERKEKI